MGVPCHASQLSQVQPPTAHGAPSSLLTWPSLGSETCLDDVLPDPDALAQPAAADAPAAAVSAPADAATPAVSEPAAPAALLLRGLSPAVDSESAGEPLTARAAAATAHAGFKRSSLSAAAAPEEEAGGGGGGARAFVKSGSIRKVRRLADGVEVVYVSTGTSTTEQPPLP